MTPTLSYKTKGILVIFPIGSKSGTLDLDTSLLFTVAMSLPQCLKQQL